MKRQAKSESEGSSVLLRRRDVLTFGAAGLLAPLFNHIAWAEPLAAAAERSAQTLPMSVGYIDGSEDYRSFKRLPRKIRRPLLLKEGDEEEDGGGSKHGEPPCGRGLGPQAAERSFEFLGSDQANSPSTTWAGTGLVSF